MRLGPERQSHAVCGSASVCKLALVATIIAGLGACASHRSHVPEAAPAPVAPAVEPASPAPAVESIRKPPGNTSVPPPSHVTMLDPRNEQQDRDRIKLALGKNSRDALASSEVGYYMDVLQARLKQMGGEEIGVGRKNDRIVLDMNFRPGFEPGGAQLGAGDRDALTTLSKVLVEYRMTLVSVEVHATDSDTHSGKVRLAEQRAKAVARALVDGGVASKRVVIAGLEWSPSAGATMPSENRTRVELQLEPIVRVSVN